MDFVLQWEDNDFQSKKNLTDMEKLFIRYRTMDCAEHQKTRRLHGGTNMTQPFEGILGNSCELRILEFLLGLDDLEFNVSELAEEVGVSRPTATRVVKKFTDWSLMKATAKKRGVTYYTLDNESPFVTLLEDLNNLLFESLVDDEVLYKIRDLWNERLNEKKTRMALIHLLPQKERSESIWTVKPSWKQKEHEFFTLGSIKTECGEWRRSDHGGTLHAA